MRDDERGHRAEALVSAARDSGIVGASSQHDRADRLDERREAGMRVAVRRQPVGSTVGRGNVAVEADPDIQMNATALRRRIFDRALRRGPACLRGALPGYGTLLT